MRALLPAAEFGVRAEEPIVRAIGAHPRGGEERETRAVLTGSATGARGSCLSAWPSVPAVSGCA